MNQQNIINALDLATAAYRNVQPHTPHSLTMMINEHKMDIQCFLRRYNDVLTITFRGSDSHRDWKTNLSFFKKTVPYGNNQSKIRVHSGFLNAYKTPVVRDRLHKTITPDINFIKINGHSLGAALAVLCAVDLQYHFPELDIETYLFGCPRVGNREFVHSYNKRVTKTVRVENGNDIVTKLPFSLMNYHHVGALIHIGKTRLPFVYSPLDHYPHKYYSSLLTAFFIRN